MVLEQLDVIPIQGRDEQNGKVVVRVLVDLRALVLVADVFDRQRMKLECLLEELVVGVVRRLDIQPEALLVRVGEAARDVLDPRRRR